MLREEMKKIWRPGILLILLLLGAVYYMMYLDFYVVHFPNGPNNEAMIETAADLIKAYGTTLEPQELEEFAAMIPALEAEADAYIREYPLAQQYGLDSYASYLEFRNETNLYSGELSEAEQEKHSAAMLIQNYLWSDETGNIYGRLYATEEYVREYGVWQANGVDVQTRAYDTGYSAQEYDNAERRFFGDDNAWRNIMPYEVPEATSTYLGYLLIWMSLSACILLSPILVRDRMWAMRPLQWSARRGRGILKTQFATTMLSAFLITTVNLLIFGGLFLTNGISVFAGSRMFSFMMTGFCWVNWSYGLWCAVLIIMCYLVTLGTAALAFFLSRFSGNYVAMLLKLIPLIVACAILAPRLIIRAFYYGNGMYIWTPIPMIELIVAGLVIMLGFALCGAAITRQKKQDLLTM